MNFEDAFNEEDLRSLSPRERRLLFKLLDDLEHGRSDTYNNLAEVDFEVQPVGIREFLTDTELLGNTGQISNWEDATDEEQGIYAFWRQELDDLFDPNKRYQQWIVSAAIGSGKSFVAIIAILYKIYWLLCLRSPQQYCGINRNSSITFGFFSATREIGRATEYAMLTSIMGDSPFFRRMAGAKEQYRSHELLKLPKNIHVAFGSRAQHALGQNLLGGLMDEAAFGLLLEDRQMSQLFDGFWRRLQSRYSESISPGLLILASSKAAPADFLEQHIKKWATADNADLVKVTRGALYRIKPHQFRARDNFRIQIGDDIRPSRMLELGEIPEPGFQVEEIPNHPALRAQYNADLEGALRDISAICVTNASPLIALREKLQACIDHNRLHPFTVETAIAGTRDVNFKLEHLFIKEEMLVRRIRDWRPRINSDHPRHLHIDIGLTRDALGLAMIHLAGERQVHSMNPLGEFDLLDYPIVYVDLMLRVKARPGDQVDLSKIREFIMFLARDAGFGIGMVSADSFQSADMLQLVAKAGFPVQQISVDRSEVPYLALASLIMNDCVSYYEYPIVLKELRELQRDMEKHKVDHGINGSKDVADALAGAVFSALKNKVSFKMGDPMPLTTRDLILRGDSKKGPSDYSWVVPTEPGTQVKPGHFRNPVYDIFKRPVD